MKFDIYQESRTGGRKYNQDRVGYVYSRDALLMIVADGMGGHARGELAAQITLETIARRFQREATPVLANPSGFLHTAINAAHTAILAHAEKNGMLETPRTTVVAAVIQKGSACWAHVGDSRMYLLRGGQIAIQTIDHSHVQQLFTQGLIRAEAMATHPERNKIYNCLGAHILPRVDVSAKHVLQSGDTLLLCSDGVWGALPAHLLAGAFIRDPLAKAVPALMTQAEQRAGAKADNLTALAMTWDEGETAVEHVSTVMLAAGESNPQTDAGAAAPDVEMSDDDIEKAISDIKNALAKTNRPQ